MGSASFFRQRDKRGRDLNHFPMNFMVRSATNIAIAFVLVGCGAGSGGTPISGINPSVLSGTWILSCQEFDGGHVSDELRFSGAQMSRTVSNYSDASCSVMTRFVRVDHEVFIPEASSFMPEAYDVNLTVLGSEASVIDAKIADDFSAQERCDIQSWSAGEIVDLSSAPQGCYEGDYPPPVGDAAYTIMRPDSETLEIGQNSSFNDGKSVAKRHVAFSDQVYSK